MFTTATTTRSIMVPFLFSSLVFAIGITAIGVWNEDTKEIEEFEDDEDEE